MAVAVAESTPPLSKTTAFLAGITYEPAAFVPSIG
jgi:hypothetical protein